MQAIPCISCPSPNIILLFEITTPLWTKLLDCLVKHPPMIHMISVPPRQPHASLTIFTPSSIRFPVIHFLTFFLSLIIFFLHFLDSVLSKWCSLSAFHSLILLLQLLSNYLSFVFYSSLSSLLFFLLTIKIQ